MQRTQIQLPDHLFEASRALARRKEISLAELVRRGLEYLIATSPESPVSGADWELPAPRDLRATDPFVNANWRADIHSDRLQVAEPSSAYNTGGDNGGISAVSSRLVDHCFPSDVPRDARS